MNEAFNKWWNSDELIKDNPFSKDTPAFWAWEGWVAGVKAEREAGRKDERKACTSENEDPFLADVADSILAEWPMRSRRKQ